ncbi:uncharacterized protein LOC131304044 [Rhododendron vialii]|uniref:uncharacterized protein LOC131304044 n=1 Tax=Rhododendron vialii TaxID=182163 RepID=UPI00265D7C86|nr:uncharacterized protein LOC131304044 [Rhododendron vialii]
MLAMKSGSDFTSADSGDFGSSFSRDLGRGRDYRHSGHFDRVFGGHDSGRCGFSRIGRMSRGGGHSRGHSSRLCTYCGVTNHTVDHCYDLHGFPQAHRVTSPKDIRQAARSTAMVTISMEEYQRLVSLQTSSSIATLSQTGSQDGAKNWWWY